MTECLKSLYVDMPSWTVGIKEDDFIVAVGKTKSNSVYHVFKSNPKPRERSRITRYYVKVVKTDLVTALRRDSSQKLIPIKWYKR